MFKMPATEEYNFFGNVFGEFIVEQLNSQAQESESGTVEQVFSDSMTLFHGQLMRKGHLEK